MTQPNSWNLREKVMDAIDKSFNTGDWRVALNIGHDLSAEIESNFRCPHVVSSDEGTSHCELAESSSTAHEAELAKIGNELCKAESSVKDLQAALAEKEKEIELSREGFEIISKIRKSKYLSLEHKISHACSVADYRLMDLDKLAHMKDKQSCKTTENIPVNSEVKDLQAEEELARSRPNNAADHLGDLT